MKIVFLGRLAERFGSTSTLEPQASWTVADAISACAGDQADMLTAPGISYVLDHEVVRAGTPLADAEELAFLPPVSGG